MLTVTEVASDLQLLSAAERRVAAGLEDDDASQDDALATLGLRVAAALAGACGVAKAGYAASYASESPPLVGLAPVTLKLESLEQKFRSSWGGTTLYLARRPVSAITSVTGNGSVLGADEYELDVSQGALIKMSGYYEVPWPNGRTVVAYDAGYDPIPDGLKAYAARLMSLYYQTDGADTNERVVDIPDVIRVERWVNSVQSDIIVPDDIMTGLLRDGFRQSVLA